MNIEDNSFTGTELMVLKYIQENPGCHLRKIKKEVNVSMGSVQYFLGKLENNGKITSQRKGLHKHYFPTGIFEENEREILQFLTRETDREIIFFIIENVNPTQTDINSQFDGIYNVILNLTNMIIVCFLQIYLSDNMVVQ